MKSRLSFLLLVIATLAPKSAFACAMCMGSSDAPIAPAVNASIFLLLGIVLAVGGCFFKFLLFLARQDGIPLEPHQEISQSLATQAPQQS
jgi:hypothetical protein